MTVKLDRVVVRRRKLEHILKSERMQADLANRAAAAAAEVRSAGIRVEGVPGRVELPVTVTVRVGRSRARSRVILDHPSGIAVEAKHGVLAASIDAARTG